MIQAVRAFLDLVLESPSVDAGQLARALDGLAALYHAVPVGQPADADLDPPARDYQRTRSALEPRFPYLGYYGTAAPLELRPNEPLVGDAIDDLADIVGDLVEVAWRWDALGAADAHWNFRLLYQIHWGRHLHDLRSCLHAIQFESIDRPAA